MQVDSVRRCVKEMQIFLEAWETIQLVYVTSAVDPRESSFAEWLNEAAEIGRERDLLNETSVRLSCALRDLRQGR